MARVRSALVVLVVAAGWCGSAGGASAKPAEVAFDGTTATLTTSDAGGWTAKVGVTNLTGAQIDGVTVKASGCSPSANPVTLPAAQHTDLTITLPADCKATASDGGFPFVVSTGGQRVQVTATKKDAASSVDWAPFEAFLWALGVGAALMLIVAGVYAQRDHPSPKPLAPLAGLDKSWTFKDSWASSLTTASGLVVALFGTSEPLKAVLGEDADATVGAATVAAAVALALTGAAAVISLAVKKPGDSRVTVTGLLGGCAVAFGAAGGQIWTLRGVLDKVDLGVGNAILFWAAIGASALLVVYACTSVYNLLVLGLDDTEKPLTETVDPEVYAAAIEVAQERGETLSHETVEAILAGLKVPETAAAPASLAGRSALL